ncbi:DUF4232 domain-containing protein [Saccharopolyspora spinosa]|uniref:Uncharacterized protein DUF4232 n=1 Tax=Saccharopolyspora spinosa TaxID=60894 RepID=A0A2N3XR64_SACSN|nr:DUF4232 domain-containing protein [Saccharopolyspora spinosa]PKW13155.1 uncharacterized protein DUF4232 [Saccharopolyspora spinosa]
MMLNQTRTLGAIAGLFTGALLLAGCGQSTPAPVPSSGGVSTPAPAAGIAAGDSSSTPVNEPAPWTHAGGQQIDNPDCTASDIKVDLQAQPDRPGVLLMAATNKSEKTCNVSGWADITATDMSGADSKIPVEKVKIPGGPTKFELAPGKTAFAGVRLNLGDKGGDVTVTGFQVKVPGVNGPVNANFLDTKGKSSVPQIPLKSLKVGTLQPVAQGVTVF